MEAIFHDDLDFSPASPGRPHGQVPQPGSSTALTQFYPYSRARPFPIAPDYLGLLLLFNPGLWSQSSCEPAILLPQLPVWHLQVTPKLTPGALTILFWVEPYFFCACTLPYFRSPCDPEIGHSIYHDSRIFPHLCHLSAPTQRTLSRPSSSLANSALNLRL